MNPELFELLRGAGLADLVGGWKGNAKAGFIRRLMAENQHKHKGKYKRPVWKLADDSKMKQPWKFKYSKIANREQNGENVTQYGASPFLTKHFGSVRAEDEEDSDEDNAPPPPPSVAPLRESKAQKEARKGKYADSKNIPFRGRKKDAPVEAPAPEEKAEKQPRKRQKKAVLPSEGDDFTIPEEAEGLITREEVEGFRDSIMSREKSARLYKSARAVLPDYRKWKRTPPIITKIDKLTNAKGHIRDEYRRVTFNKVYERIGERLKDYPRGLGYKEEEKRLFKLATAPLKELEEKYEKDLPNPPITEENVASFNPTYTASYWNKRKEDEGDDRDGDEKEEAPASVAIPKEAEEKEEKEEKDPPKAKKENPQVAVAREYKDKNLQGVGKDDLRGLLRRLGGNPRLPNSRDHYPVGRVREMIKERIKEILGA